MKKYCTKCGREFEAVGREVICAACKQAAAEETKRAAVLRAKRASWAGESVPVRISGRASTLIRKYGAANNMPFAESLDALLKATSFFEKLGVEWSAVQPYKSRRRDKHATETDDKQNAPQEVKQAAKEVKQDKQDKPVKQAAKVTGKTASKASKTVKTAAGKAASKK